MVNTQYNMQMMYYRVVHLKQIILLTNVTPNKFNNFFLKKENQMDSALPTREPWWYQMFYPEPVTVMRQGGFKPHYLRAEVGPSSLCFVQNGKGVHWEGSQSYLQQRTRSHCSQWVWKTRTSDQKPIHVVGSTLRILQFLTHLVFPSILHGRLNYFYYTGKENWRPTR